MATIEQAIETIVQAKVDDAEARNEQLKKRHDWLLANVDTLLGFVEHERTSCSDETPGNASDDPNHSRCTRCQLLRIKREDWNDGWMLNVSLSYEEVRTIDRDELRRQIQKL